MSEEMWTICEHVISASHIRGFSRGIRDEQKGRLRLAVKQYIPKAHTEPTATDATLIMMGGIGSSKEIYEPFYDELLQRGLRIRAVWSMDTAHHGASYVLNEGMIGDEPHWFDSSRDLLHMMNHFQELMPPPLIAMGLSWGCVSIVSLAIFHPRLFSGIVLMEPTLRTTSAVRRIDRIDTGIDLSHRAVAMVKRRDLWPSLEDASNRLRATPHFGPFDSRVFERVIKYHLRPASPAMQSYIGSPDAVTLTTPKSMEPTSITVQRIWTRQSCKDSTVGKPSSRAQSKKGTTTSPIKKASAPARKRRASPRPRQPKNENTQSRAQSIISVHGSDSGTPSTPSSPGPRILTIVHPSDRTLITRLSRLPAVNSRLRLRHRRDLATHLPPLGDPTERRVAILEAQAAELQEWNNKLGGKWKEELDKAIETEEGDWRRGMLKAKKVELELKRVELGLRWELMLREEMTYE